MSLHADLASLVSSLDQMLERIESAAEAVKDTSDSELLVDFYEVERNLKMANRRLNRALAAREP